MLKFSPTKHPGSGFVYVICDICGRKVRQNFTTIVRDKFNLQNNMVVCHDDIDKANAQARPFRVKERLISHPEQLRSEPGNTFISIENDNRLPSAPRNLSAAPSTLGTSVTLFWEGPLDPGTSSIIGYVIKKAEPQYAYQFVVNSNTGTNAVFYDDTSGDIATGATYTVAAINSFGTGPDSPLAFYPSVQADSSVNYLVASDTNYTITTGSGVALVL